MSRNASRAREPNALDLEAATEHRDEEHMEYSIRRAREKDAESIVELLNPIIEEGTFTIIDAPISVKDQLDFIRGFPKRGVYHVAVCKDSRRVLGIQDVQPISETVEAFKHVGEISTFVSLASQRKGIGRSLSQVTFRAANELGFMKLRATIRADNPEAIAFYLGQGFEIIGTAPKHACVRGEYIDEVLAERFIA
jgi:L-amino acid N-acyltransferase YncA